ncbi:hypothetical protein QR77_14865 [Streptomyces sp. 150FB]|uniref:hypothetical protein n=1 Tax=Streptomyces sp. 150FB TaxID=1576605 RepID=UPI0005895D6A|nr:hypothetical protein [Streptomyces sp. 150FB]KIF74892.1 hypothetical protein QR77_14865 [Streptomyces sp. 150FB]
MNNDVFREISTHLPLAVEDCHQDPESDTLFLSGSEWRLRVSGPWRLTTQNVIEASRDTEATSDMAGKVRSLVGSQIVDVQPQSRFNTLDIALLMRDGRVLEIFSDYIYDNWLLSVGGVAIEGPLQSLGSGGQ